MKICGARISSQQKQTCHLSGSPVPGLLLRPSSRWASTHSMKTEFIQVLPLDRYRRAPSHPFMSIYLQCYQNLKSDRSSVTSIFLAGIQLGSHFLWNLNLTCRKLSLPVMNRKDESSLELEATAAALVPALQFATLQSSYHLTQGLPTTATAGNRMLMAPILQDLSTSSRVFAHQCLHWPKLTIKCIFEFPV